MDCVVDLICIAMALLSLRILYLIANGSIGNQRFKGANLAS